MQRRRYARFTLVLLGVLAANTDAAAINAFIAVDSNGQKATLSVSTTQVRGVLQ